MRSWAQNPFKKRLRKGYALIPESARNILHAERFAYALHRKLNVCMTITFNAQPRTKGVTHYDLFRKKIWANIRRRWNEHAARTGHTKQFVAIAVFENPPNRHYGKRHYGPLHVHMMLEWPENRMSQLEYFTRRMMSKHCVAYQAKHLHIRPVWYSKGFATYMAKGIDPTFADHFYIDHKPQGPIDHRRIIISTSLGKAARAKFKAEVGNPLPNRHKRWRTPPGCIDQRVNP